MIYRAMGHIHARSAHLLRQERGQGTVEYVALILLVGAILFSITQLAKGKLDGADGIIKIMISALQKAISNVLGGS